MHLKNRGVSLLRFAWALVIAASLVSMTVAPDVSADGGIGTIPPNIDDTLPVPAEPTDTTAIASQDPSDGNNTLEQFLLQLVGFLM